MLPDIGLNLEGRIKGAFTQGRFIILTPMAFYFNTTSCLLDMRNLKEWENIWFI